MKDYEQRTHQNTAKRYLVINLTDKLSNIHVADMDTGYRYTQLLTVYGLYNVHCIVGRRNTHARQYIHDLITLNYTSAFRS